MADLHLEKSLEPWAVSHYQEWHAEPVKFYGEKVYIRSVWRAEDFEADEVERCVYCSKGATYDRRERVSSVYGQTGSSRCDHCFGVGFAGGFKPVVYLTWALFPEVEEKYKRSDSGEMMHEDLKVQFLWEPKLRHGDLLVRYHEWNGDAPIEERDRYVLGDATEQAAYSGPLSSNFAGPDLGDQRRRDRDQIILSQTSNLNRLPLDHIYNQVPVAV